jgi:hypothetical protein
MISVLAGAIASSLLAGAPYYGVTFDSFNEKRNCPPVSWLDPTGPMADAGVRLGDCLRADEQRFDEDICPALTSLPTHGVLRLHGLDGGTFAVVPGNCANAGFLIPVDLSVEGKRRPIVEVSRDTKIIEWLKAQRVSKTSDCRMSLEGECIEDFHEDASKLPASTTFGGVGCFTSAIISCGQRVAVTLVYGKKTAGFLLEPGERYSPGPNCVARAKQPHWYDCKAGKDQLDHLDAGVLP